MLSLLALIWTVIISLAEDLKALVNGDESFHNVFHNIVPWSSDFQERLRMRNLKDKEKAASNGIENISLTFLMA